MATDNILERLVCSDDSSEDNTSSRTAKTSEVNMRSFHGRIVRGSETLEERRPAGNGYSCRRISAYSPGSELLKFDVIKKASLKYNTLDRDMISEAWDKVAKKQIS